MKKHQSALIVSLIFALFTLVSFGFYYARTLQGDINNHILAGEMFGTPKALVERGIKPLYHGPGQTGWDGQFYYYMSNDVLGSKDTAVHVDAPSYRYQRVGLSLYVAAISHLLGQDWVSPTTFFISYFLLLLAATWVGARLLSSQGVNPALILLWSLSVGTQITLFNALPDAAADAFLILALCALFSERIKLAAIAFTFSALSREVYAVFPAFVALVYFLDYFQAQRKVGRGVSDLLLGFAQLRSTYWMVLPIIIVLGWRVYVTIHFGASPGSQAFGILGWPFVAWFDYFVSGMRGNHLLVGANATAYFEAVSLILFALILIVSFFSALGVLRNYLQVSPEKRGIALATIILILLYACFGPTVIMHYTGYIKAAGVFGILIPLFLTGFLIQDRYRFSALAVVVITVAFTTWYNLNNRILPYQQGDDEVTRMSKVKETRRIECFGAYKAEIKVEKFELRGANTASRIFGSGDQLVVDVALKNTGSHPLVSTRNFGSVYMSYHWLDEHGKVAKDGIRSALPSDVQPGETAKVRVISDFPKDKGAYILRLTPVQEGCAWFYMANPESSTDLHFQL